MKDTMGLSGLHIRFSQTFLYPEVNYMPVPGHFAEMIELGRPAWVSLSTTDNMRWDVQLVQEHGALFFSKGWSTFRNAYELEVGDTIVFAYDKKSHFLVTVFESNGKERASTKPEMFNDIGNHQIVALEHYIPDVNIELASDKDTVDATSTESKVKPSSMMTGKGKMKMQRKIGVTGRVTKITSRCNLINVPKIGQTSKSVIPSDGVEGSANNYTCNKNPHTPLFFFLEIEPCHVSETDTVVIPSIFAEAFVACGRQTIVLKVKWSFVWHVICTKVDGVSTISSGWHAFVAENKLKSGDACKFEASLKEKKTWIVTIYRGGM